MRDQRQKNGPQRRFRLGISLAALWTIAVGWSAGLIVLVFVWDWRFAHLLALSVGIVVATALLARIVGPLRHIFTGASHSPAPASQRAVTRALASTCVVVIVVVVWFDDVSGAQSAQLIVAAALTLTSSELLRRSYRIIAAG